MEPKAHDESEFGRKDRIEPCSGMLNGVESLEIIKVRSENPASAQNRGHQTSSTTLAFLTANPVQGDAFRLPRINLPPVLH